MPKARENNSVSWEILYLCIAYEPKLWPYSQTNDFAITHCLFRSVQLTKNAEPDKYSGYGIGFDDCSSFSLSDGRVFGKNVIFHQHTSIIKTKTILILNKGPLQGLDDTKIAPGLNILLILLGWKIHFV